VQVKSILDSIDDNDGINVTKFAQMSMQHSTGSDLDPDDEMEAIETGQVISKVPANHFKHGPLVKLPLA
jgi:hypothetical protein